MLLAVAVAAALCGCGTPKLPDYPFRSADSYTNRVAGGDFVIGALPLRDPVEVRRYFGTDLIAAQILPVIVVAENRGGGTYLLGKDQCSVASAAGTADKSNLRSTGAQGVAIAGASILSPALIVVAAHMTASRTVIEQKLAMNELKAQTVGPGATTRGFVYFRMPDKATLAGPLALRIEPRETRAKAVHAVDMEFPGQEPRR